MPIPKQSKLNECLQGAYFYDSFSREIQYDNQTALEIFIEMVTRIPVWISFLMKMRNSIVFPFGLKNVGRLENIASSKHVDDYSVGDRVGIFTLASQSPNEIILEDCDKHLNVQVSFLIEQNRETAIVHATTVVHVHNVFGKAYMFVVTPFHKLIVPNSLNKLVQA